MDALSKLRLRATVSTERRQHPRIKWDAPVHGESTQVGRCAECGMEVYLDSRPAPNSINISGQAVALNCRKERGTFQ